MTKNLLIGFLALALAASWAYFTAREKDSPFRAKRAGSWIVTPSKKDFFEFRIAEGKSFDVMFFDDGFIVDTLKFAEAPSFSGSFKYSGKQSFTFFHHGGGPSYFDSDGDGLTDKKVIIAARQGFVMQEPVWIPLQKKEPNQALEPTAPSGRGSP